MSNTPESTHCQYTGTRTYYVVVLSQDKCKNNTRTYDEYVYYVTILYAVPFTTIYTP